MKRNWLDGPRHALHQLQMLQLQDSATQKLLGPHIESLCWRVHSEMILQTMISSGDTEEWRFAVEKVMKTRGIASKGSKVIRFRPHPSLNLKAATLEELVSRHSDHDPVITGDGPAAIVSVEADGSANLPSAWPVRGASRQRSDRSGSAGGGTRQSRRLHPGSSGAQRDNANVRRQKRHAVDDIRDQSVSDHQRAGA